MNSYEINLGSCFKELSEHLAKHDSEIATIACKALLAATKQGDHSSARSMIVAPGLKKLFTQPASLTLNELANISDSLPWSKSKTKAGQYPGIEQLSTIELLGPTGVANNDIVRVGLLYLPTDTYYPNHRHAAEELYLVLSGSALWGQSKQATQICPPGTFRHHANWEWHEMITNEQPLLALYCWTGDLRFSEYEFDSA